MEKMETIEMCSSLLVIPLDQTHTKEDTDYLLGFGTIGQWPRNFFPHIFSWYEVPKSQLHYGCGGWMRPFLKMEGSWSAPLLGEAGCFELGMVSDNRPLTSDIGKQWKY